MENNRINQRFVEIVIQNAPCSTQAQCFLTSPISCLPPKVITKAILDINKEFGLSVDAEKFVSIAAAVMCKDFSQTMVEYPHLRKSQVLALFQDTLVKKDVKISSAGITRPHLITLVEGLESYTGLKMTDDSDAPLAYLDQKDETLTIEDVADFFSETDGKIAKIIASMSGKTSTTSSKSAKKKSISREKVKAYLISCCACNEAGINEQQPITSLKTEFEEDGYYTIVSWMEERFHQMVPNSIVETRTIGELIDFFVKSE